MERENKIENDMENRIYKKLFELSMKPASFTDFMKEIWEEVQDTIIEHNNANAFFFNEIVQTMLHINLHDCLSEKNIVNICDESVKHQFLLFFGYMFRNINDHKFLKKILKSSYKSVKNDYTKHGHKKDLFQFNWYGKCRILSNKLDLLKK